MDSSRRFCRRRARTATTPVNCRGGWAPTTPIVLPISAPQHSEAASTGRAVPGETTLRPCIPKTTDPFPYRRGDCPITRRVLGNARYKYPASRPAASREIALHAKPIPHHGDLAERPEEIRKRPLKEKDSVYRGGKVWGRGGAIVSQFNQSFFLDFFKTFKLAGSIKTYKMFQSIYE